MMSWQKLLSSMRLKGLYEEKSSQILAGDPRTEFERDYGRTVFSTPVRRLQDKAQVFPLEQHDAIRTRLTHSLEVSSVARSMGKGLEAIVLKKEGNVAVPHGALETIAATCGLIHDLGNPPFGHAGEKAIGEWFKKKSEDDPKFFDAFAKPGDRPGGQSQFAMDFLKFEGNAQTQRLLSRLQVLADHYGLNLTCATLSASCKYIAKSNATDATDQGRKKHGFFASENEMIDRIRAEVGTGDARNPITFLVEASDDIVYSTVDLEDGVKKGCVQWAFLERELESSADSGCLRRILKEAHNKIDPAGLPIKAHDEAMAVAFRTFAISELVVATLRVFEQQYDSIMDGKYTKEMLYESEAGELAKACKRLGYTHVYSSPEILKREIMGREIIWDLLDVYWEGAQGAETGAKQQEFEEKIFRLISENYVQVFRKNLKDAASQGIPEQYYRMQLVTDQVSGMTDSFAKLLHKELKNG